MTRIQAYFPQELYDQAMLEAKKNNQNFSQFLRQIVDNYLQTKPKKSKKKVLKFVTLKNRGTTFAAINHNDIYDGKDK